MPGRPFYRSPRFLAAVACIVPVLLLLGVWWYVSAVLLVPAVPTENTPGDLVAQFVIHPRGLPRLRPAASERLILAQVGRLARDERFREQFLAEYRRSSPEDQRAFDAHLFDALKPLVLRDAVAYRRLPEASRVAFLDRRIVEYNRLNILWGRVHISRAQLGPGAPDRQQLFDLVMNHTTQEERELVTSYLAALTAQVNGILADPERRRWIEERIEAGSE